MAWIRKFAVNHRDSAIRGTKLRCRPRKDPPRRPVTNRSSPALPPPREIHRRGSTYPKTATDRDNGPGVLLVSPPTICTPKRAAAAVRPAYTLRTQFRSVDVRAIKVTRANRGSPDTAAKSLKGRIIAFHPTDRGLVPLRKCTVSTTQSHFKTRSLPRCARTIAQSSPAGRTTSFL